MFCTQKQGFSHTHIAQAAPLLIATIAATLTLGCTPAFNWRDVAFDGAPVAALLPCKPDRATRMVPLAGAARPMVMAGCEAGGAMFTVAVITLDDSAKVAQASAELRAANKATHSQYLQQGATLVQASVYGVPKGGGDGPSALSTQAVETFFGGIKLTGQP